MQNRFCSIIKDADGENILSNLLASENIRFTIDKRNVNDEEATCFYLQSDSDVKRVTDLFDRSQPNISYPFRVPAWKEIRENNGPYMAPFTIRLDGAEEPNVLRHVNEPISITMSSTLSQYVALYAFALRYTKNHVDDVFKSNYWSDLRRLLGDYVPFKSLDDIDFSKFVRAVRTENVDDDDKTLPYRTVQIDGTTARLEHYAAPSAFLMYTSSEDPNRGRYHRAIQRDDVVLNLMPNDRLPTGFTKRVYVPAAAWSSKWKDPVSGSWKYVLINFDDIVSSRVRSKPATGERLSSSRLFSPMPAPSMPAFPAEFESASSDDDEDEDSDDDDDDTRSVEYGSEFAEHEDMPLFGEEEEGGVGVGEEEEEGGMDDWETRRNANVARRMRLERAAKGAPDEDENVESLLDVVATDFTDLNSTEADLLPLNYVVSQEMQWEAILVACSSNFSLVSNLTKVNDKLLSFIADACYYAVEKKGMKTRFIANTLAYAQQRAV